MHLPRRDSMLLTKGPAEGLGNEWSGYSGAPDPEVCYFLLLPGVFTGFDI